MNLRYPDLNAPDTEGKLRQLQSYLYQLVDALNMGMEQQAAAAKEVTEAARQIGQSVKELPATPMENFQSIKALIIKSADIVEAYGETISKSLEGKYVAISDFGTYTEDQLVQLDLAPDSLKSTMERVQTISDRQDSDYDMLMQEISNIEQKAGEVEVRVSRVESEGVSEVRTSTGYTFNAEGLTISKEGEAVTNLLNHSGMYVQHSGTTILQADGNGVEAKDVTVRNYLEVGDHARFEDYSNGTDTRRTACFWKGE